MPGELPPIFGNRRVAPAPNTISPEGEILGDRQTPEQQGLDERVNNGDDNETHNSENDPTGKDPRVRLMTESQSEASKQVTFKDQRTDSSTGENDSDHEDFGAEGGVELEHLRVNSRYKKKKLGNVQRIIHEE